MIYILLGLNFFLFLWVKNSIYSNKRAYLNQIRELGEDLDTLKEEVKLLKVKKTVFDTLEIEIGDRESIRFVQWLYGADGLKRSREDDLDTWEKQKDIDKKAVKEWSKQKNEPEAQYNLGIAYHFGWGAEKDDKKALSWILKASENFWSPATRDIGMAYFLGRIVEQSDQKAFEYWEIAAETDTEARFLLGMAYANGIGTEKDISKAMLHFEDAAHFQHPLACYYLGNYYFEKPEDQDLGYKKKVFNLWHEAAKQNLAQAQRNLGCAYYEGYGVQQNYDKAIKWWKHASEQGDNSAEEFLIEYEVN